MNIDTTPNQATGTTSSLMIYPRCLSRLSACDVVSTLDSFTGRDSRKPSGVYGFKSVSMCQIAVRSIRQMAMMAFLCPRRAFMRRYRVVNSGCFLDLIKAFATCTRTGLK